jgi:hypothetical protein
VAGQQFYNTSPLTFTTLLRSFSIWTPKSSAAAENPCEHRSHARRSAWGAWNRFARRYLPKPVRVTVNTVVILAIVLLVIGIVQSITGH